MEKSTEGKLRTTVTEYTFYDYSESENMVLMLCNKYLGLIKKEKRKRIFFSHQKTSALENTRKHQKREVSFFHKLLSITQSLLKFYTAFQTSR